MQNRNVPPADPKSTEYFDGRNFNSKGTKGLNQLNRCPYPIGDNRRNRLDDWLSRRSNRNEVWSYSRISRNDMENDHYKRWNYALVDIITGRVLYSGTKASEVIFGLEPGTTYARHEDLSTAIANAKSHALRWLDTKRRFNL